MCVADEIAREIKKQAQSTVGQALLGTGLALGTITPTMKLKLDDFKYELEFMTIESIRILEPNDRVLVAIINGGVDHIIVGKVV